jgi:hypothetical protein
MKKTIGIVLCAILALCALYIIGSGFTKCGSAFIQDYIVSDDGTEMTITVGVGSSVGYIRKVSVHQQEGGKLYLDCIYAFGGINGSIGAKSDYVISLDDDTYTICLYRYGSSYEAVLERDDFRKWNRVK